MIPITESRSTSIAEVPAKELDQNIDAALLSKINELTEQLAQEKAQQAELKDNLKLVTNRNGAYSQLLNKILTCTQPVLKHSHDLAKRETSEEFIQLQKELQAALFLSQKIEGSRKLLDKIVMEDDEEAPFVNSVDSHYQKIEASKAPLIELYEKHLKPTNTQSIKDIAGQLEKLRKNFCEVKDKLNPSLSGLFTYVQNLRKFIDFLEAHPIEPLSNPSIAQYLAMLDDNMISCLEFDVCNIEEKVKILTGDVKTQVDKNGSIINALKARHDKMLKQYIEIQCLFNKIELRLSKFSHHVAAHPRMLALKEDSSRFNSRLLALRDLLQRKQGTLFSLVKQVFSFLIEYNGKNPLKDDKFPDSKFETKIHMIEKTWEEKKTKYKEDAEYCSYRDGSAQLPEKGLFDRALEMKETAEQAIAMLNKLLEDYETNKVMKSIYNQMKFYDETEDAELKKNEKTDFINELDEISDLLVNFSADWQQTSTLFSKDMYDTLNIICSSVLTNEGVIRSGTAYNLKGLVGGNTIYALPPFK